MSHVSRFLAGAAAVTVGALAVASLALVHVVPGWGVLFFYVVPSAFFLLWSLRELRPSVWRRTAPLRRTVRASRIGPSIVVPALTRPRPKTPPAEPRRISLAVRVLAEAAEAWLLVLRGPLETLRRPRARRFLNAVFVLAAAALVFLVVRDVVGRGWPLRHAAPAGIAASLALFLSTFELRALGWQRLFRPFERPRSLALTGANGIAAVAALALPSRVDDAIAIGMLRRFSPRAPSIGTLALSLFLLGLVDMAALTPFAVFAAVATPGVVAVRAAMAGMAGIGLGAAVLAAALPSIRGSERLVRYRLGHWLALHAPASARDALWSWFLVGASWATRAGGLYVLLQATGLGAPFSTATAYVVAAAGAASLPVGPAGAATQAGVGAAVLAGAGIATRDAVAFAIAAQALTVVAGAILGGLGAGFSLSRRRRR